MERPLCATFFSFVAFSCTLESHFGKDSHFGKEFKRNEDNFDFEYDFDDGMVLETGFDFDTDVEASIMPQMAFWSYFEIASSLVILFSFIQQVPPS